MVCGALHRHTFHVKLPACYDAFSALCSILVPSLCYGDLVVLFTTQVRKLVLDMVLQTDMDVHFTLLEKFNVALTAVPDVHKWTALEQRSLLFQMLVHLADLANPSRPWPLALNWAEWVVTEFMQQVGSGGCFARLNLEIYLCCACILHVILWHVQVLVFMLLASLLCRA